MKFGAIEAGGTKFVLSVGDEYGNVENRISFPTTTPEETLDKVIEYFKDKNVIAIGAGFFGPIDPDLNSPTYGYVTTTPKEGWSNFNVVEKLNKALKVPIGFDTDVNLAALGEYSYGSSKGLDSVLYLTIGTGIGGGAIVEGKLLHGLLHPEMGHVKLVKHPKDNYGGKCPYHQTCFEGLASGPAIEDRWNKRAYDIEESHFAWELEAYYIAQALCNYILVLSPKKIILGGGVMHQLQLFPLIHKNVQEMLNGYVSKEELTTNKIKDYIIPPSLNDNAGVSGALALAKSLIKL